MRTMLFPQYRKPNGDANTFREVKHLTESEVRAIVEELLGARTELRAKLKAEQERLKEVYAEELKDPRRSLNFRSIPSYTEIEEPISVWDLSEILQPYQSALEKFEKLSRAKARAEKKNLKDSEEKRIAELASSLRKNMDPVEKALAESIIERRMKRLKDQTQYFEKLKNRVEVPTTYSGTPSNEEKGILDYYYFRQNFGEWFTLKMDNDYRNSGGATVSKKEGVEERIERDAKIYAKGACDAFASKIVRRTEEVIKDGRLGTTEKITKTEYQGGNNPWGGAVVVVTTNKGQYRWNTKVILNFSGLGTPYNQWPTRLEGSNEEL